MSKYSEEEIPVWDFGFFKVNMIGYQAQVLPVVMAAFMLVYLERFFRKITPQVVSMIALSNIAQGSAVYRRLISLRKSIKIIQEREIHFILNDKEQILAYERRWKNEHMIVLNNLTSETVQIDFPDDWNKYRKIIGNYNELNRQSRNLILRPYETITLYHA